MRHALELSISGSGEGEAVFDVGCARAGLGVMGQFILLVLAELQVFAGEADRLPPLIARITPELVPLVRRVGVDEELDLHLLELARAEREIPRRDLVAKRLALLRDAEGNL